MGKGWIGWVGCDWGGVAGCSRAMVVVCVCTTRWDCTVWGDIARSWHWKQRDEVKWSGVEWGWGSGGLGARSGLSGCVVG